MVPPQFTPSGASWDPDRSAGCTGPYPSSPTARKGFGQAAPKGIPHRRFHCLAPTGSSLAEQNILCTGFLQRVLEDEISFSLPPPFAEVNKNFGFFSSFCIKIPFCFCKPFRDTQNPVRIAKTPGNFRGFGTYFIWARKKAH